MADKVADFSGWATKAGLKCSDGRTIMHDAFKDQDGQTVPLVWQHDHDNPGNVLGHAVLEARAEGMYAHCFVNPTQAGQNAKQLVIHKDITHMSIYANRLVEKSKQVTHGIIREVSLVLAGANPGALIDNIAVQHMDGSIDRHEDEAYIFTDESLQHSEGDVEHASTDTQSTDQGPSLEEIYNSMSKEQKSAVEYLVGAAVEAATEAAAQHSDEEEKEEDGEKEEVDPKDIPEGKADAVSNDNDNEGDDLNHKEGTEMRKNVFEGSDTNKQESYSLSHSDIKGIFEDAKKTGSVKEAVENFALKHGIEDIDTLFPDAKSVTATPDFLARRTAWVAGVLDGCKHTPFSRIKNLWADLTLDDARAKGYVKGNMKREEFFRVARRVTTPQTVYKKQKLDRDDILDITDFDVVVWLKGELRLMLEEELARAILMGDGRSNADEDKIKDPGGIGDGAGIRSITGDDDLYSTTVYVNVDDADSTWEEVVDALVLQRRHYRGSGNPTFYTTEDALARMLLIKDTVGRRIYPTAQDLAAAIRVKEIVAVEVMDQDDTLVGIMVNLQDYTIGADRGGDLTMFDQFDIDYNQQKYLLETRVSGALTKPKSALVVRKTAATDTLVDPTAPTFDGTTVTVPTDTNVVYTNAADGSTLTQGSTVAVAAGDTLTVEAAPTAGHYFATNDVEWSFTNEA